MQQQQWERQPGTGGGRDSGVQDAAVDTGGNNGADSGGTTDAGCKSDPRLHASTPGDIFCGYTDAGHFDCMTGQQCCLGGKQGSGFAPETCTTWGDTCSNGTNPIPIECEQPQDCAANGKPGAVCCLKGGASVPAPVAGCDPGDLKSKGGKAIVCEGGGTVGDAGATDGGADGSATDDGGGASDAGAADAGAATGCATGELQVCESQSDCPSGKTCTPTRWKLYEIGVCL